MLPLLLNEQLEILDIPVCIVKNMVHITYANVAYKHYIRYAEKTGNSPATLDSVLHNATVLDLKKIIGKSSQATGPFFVPSATGTSASGAIFTCSIHCFYFVGNEANHTILVFSDCHSTDSSSNHYSDKKYNTLAVKYIQSLIRADMMNGPSSGKTALLADRNENADTFDEELEMAKSIQAGLLPKQLPDIINVKSYAVYIPTGKVGGDLYDIIITPTQKIAILIFDVSGHGIPAAMIAAMAKMLFAQYIDKLESPAQIFAEVNRALCLFVKTDHYLTAFLGILEPITCVMHYSRAGHVRPIVHHAKSKNLTTLDTRGSFIGHAALADIAGYSETSIRLEPGDKVLFYTDGLSEGYNSANNLYGSKRVENMVRQNGALPLETFLNALVEDQREFREDTPLHDDFTLLGIEIQTPDKLLRESGFLQSDEPGILVLNKVDQIEKMCAVVLKEMDRSGFSDRLIKRFKICLFEMLTNAIEHGNNYDVHKKVMLLYKVTSEKVVVSVIDEGDGFDHRVVPDPLSPENILKERGRGLYIVAKYSHTVEHNELGTRIKVTLFSNR